MYGTILDLENFALKERKGFIKNNELYTTNMHTKHVQYELI